VILWQICYEGGVHGCKVEGRWAQPHHSVCTTLLPVWTNGNLGCLATELLVSLTKAWHVLWGVVHILQNDPPLSIQMDGLCIKCVECTLCTVTVFVMCSLHQPLVPCCSTSPKYKKESENPSPCSFLTYHSFAQLSHLVAVRQGMCCFYLTSACKYALFSF
jgi:hypothetical protein